MSSELEIRKDGTASMMYVKRTAKDVPWHTAGTALNAPPTVTEGLIEAGLDWEVSVHPMYSNVVIDGRDPVTLSAKTRMVVRNSDGKRLSEVGPIWHPLQNREAFEWFQPFLDSGQATLETAGSLFGGERIWVLAKLNKDPMIITGDDSIDKFLLLSNTHNDKRSTRCCLTAIRTVCANTEAMAFRSKASKWLGVRHNKNNILALETVRETINVANNDFEATAEQYRALTKLQVTPSLLKKYVKLVFKEEKEEEVPPVNEGKRKYQTNENDGRLIENKIIPLFEDGKGANLPGVKGTMWAAYNAISEYLNWNAGRTIDARLDSLWFGVNNAVNHRALDVALDMLKKAA